jgi:hypothetical protein
MAILTEHGTLSGRVGDLVFRTVGNRQVVSHRPRKSKIKRSKKQKESTKLFSEAVVYAKSVMADPVKRTQYEKKLEKGQTVFTAVVSEYMKKARLQKM